MYYLQIHTLIYINIDTDIGDTGASPEASTWDMQGNHRKSNCVGSS